MCLRGAAPDRLGVGNRTVLTHCDIFINILSLDAIHVAKFRIYAFEFEPNLSGKSPESVEGFDSIFSSRKTAAIVQVSQGVVRMDKGLPFPSNLILEAVEFRSRAVAIKGPLQLIEERHRL